MSSSADHPRGLWLRSTAATVVPVAGWEVARAQQGGDSPPEGGWVPVEHPGVVPSELTEGPVDDEDWWWRAALPRPGPAEDGELVLEMDGITPPARIFLDRELLASVDSMFMPLSLPLPATAQTVTVHVRGLTAELDRPRRPRARWRAAIADNRLRFIRTSLFGRAPGLGPAPPVIGPWRPARVVRHHELVIESMSLRTAVRSGDGELRARVGIRSLGHRQVHNSFLTVRDDSGNTTATIGLSQTGTGSFAGSATIRDVALWWPHTHGRPRLYDVTLCVEWLDGSSTSVPVGHVGFRTLRTGAGMQHRVDIDGLDLHVNDVAVFARGAIWTRPGGLTAPIALRQLLEEVCAAGLNMLRIPGTGVYETAEFHDLCDELGILLWQDAMLANFDYPASDPDFLSTLERETTGALQSLAGRPSFVVFCGGSEVEQQAAMLGQDPALARTPLLDEVLPRLLLEAEADAIWVRNSPCGGDVPFRVDVGIAHYFGVGGYRRPLHDARAAGVRFASECLAFSNVPDDDALAEFGDNATEILAARDWLRGIPQDNGTDWNFEDVRDHYLRELWGVDPTRLRSADSRRYLELARIVTGEVMAAVFAEWRRPASPCTGGLVLWLCDQVPGAGWGLFDHRGRPKPVLRRLRAVFAPVAVWMTDEGLNGVSVHVANDSGVQLDGQLRIRMFRHDGLSVATGERPVVVSGHSTWTESVEAITGGFVDASWAYRFGPPTVSFVTAALVIGREVSSRALYCPPDVPRPIRTAEELGLRVEVAESANGIEVELSASQLLHDLSVSGPGLEPAHVLFVEPGEPAQLFLRRTPGGLRHLTVSAGNLDPALDIDLASAAT